MQTPIRISRNKINLLLDVGLAAAFVIELERRFTGLRNHELIGLALGLALLIHILLHWRWIVGLTVNWFKNFFHSSRLSYLLNAVLLIDMLVIVVTGIAISRTLGLNLGIARQTLGTFESLHRLASNLSLILVAAHVAVHWQWIVTQTGKLFSRSRRSGRLQSQLQPQTAMTATSASAAVRRSQVSSPTTNQGTKQAGTEPTFEGHLS